MNNGYSLCLNEWALDKEIKNELGLLLIISSLCAKKGFCYASNDYLAKIFYEDVSTISRKVKKLESKKYIEVSYKMRGSQIVAREIRLTKMSSDRLQKCHWSNDKKIIGTNDENAKENNISINNININNIREKREKKKARPSLQEIQAYVREKKLLVNAEQFYDYFEAGNWKDSKGQPVRNWKQKILTWNKFESKQQPNTTNPFLDLWKEEEN